MANKALKRLNKKLNAANRATSEELRRLDAQGFPINKKSIRATVWNANRREAGVRGF